MSVLAEGSARPDAARIAAGFRSPPIAEVSLAIGFKNLRGLHHVMALSDLWRTKYKDDFPNVREEAPIRMPLERFDGSTTPPFSFEMGNIPSLPRLWFLSEKGMELVQVQSDWFARNWRDMSGTQPYPLYPRIRAAFVADLQRLEEFVREEEIGSIEPIQCEITYINHVDEPDPSRVLRSLTAVPELPQPESTALTTQYVMTSDSGLVGRLYVQAGTAIHRESGKPITVVNITARGRPLGEGIDGALSFLDMGADRALDAFVNSTRAELHEKWSEG